MKLVDTHCHIHDSEFLEKFELSRDELVANATAAGVEKLICVGTSVKSSREALEFCANRENCYASIAIHPHEAAEKSSAELQNEFDEIISLAKKGSPKLVAIGETGLDYFYHNDNEVHKMQQNLFRNHIELALANNLPMIFHIRDAFDDFFSIIDEYQGVRGVVHSFSADSKALRGIVDRGLYVGLNGIVTFTKNSEQLEAAKAVPIENLVLETDAPFLTPSPLRGTINEPKHVILITKFLSELRENESQAFLAKQTTENATKLFHLN